MFHKYKFILSLLFSFGMLSSCDKENINKEYGQYAVTFNYTGSHYLELLVYVNGELSGSFSPVPNVIPSSTSECSDLKNPETLTNVYVIKNVAKGEHRVELKTKTNELVTELEFEMVDKECVFQNFNLLEN